MALASPLSQILSERQAISQGFAFPSTTSEEALLVAKDEQLHVSFSGVVSYIQSMVLSEDCYYTVVNFFSCF